MTLQEFYVERQKAEAPIFLKVLKALPQDRLDYKPHDRSPSAGQLAWTLTGELKSCLDIIRENTTDWVDVPAPAPGEMVELFEQRSREISEAVSRMDDAAWTRPARFYYRGKLVSEQPVGTFLWFVLFDAIHHRGQLAAYLRPMGGKVPSIYGPSPDEKTS